MWNIRGNWLPPVSGRGIRYSRTRWDASWFGCRPVLPSTRQPRCAIPALKHVAIANPQHAPYGRAAQAALRSLGVYQSVEPKLVLGENIAQTLQFVESGAADAGIVALSLALAPPVRARGRYWEIPLDAYPRMEQGGIILKDSKAARDFRDFLLSGRRPPHL